MTFCLKYLSWEGWLHAVAEVVNRWILLVYWTNEYGKKVMALKENGLEGLGHPHEVGGVSRLVFVSEQLLVCQAWKRHGKPKTVSAVIC